VAVVVAVKNSKILQNKLKLKLKFPELGQWRIDEIFVFFWLRNTKIERKTRKFDTKKEKTKKF
jgi:hypothetical protein